jgi:peptide deformylase
MHPDILMIPNPKLKKKTSPLTEFDTDMLFTVSNSMLKALEHYNGVGLACTQIGLSIPMFVAHPTNKIYTMINPIIIHSGGKYTSKEGCLSIPGYWDEITRAEIIKVEYNDITGKEKEETIIGFDAAVIQHEIDHLKGILFIDYLSTIKQARARKKVDYWKRRNSLKHKTKRSA